MTKIIRFFCLILLLVSLMATDSGYAVTRAITVEYLPGQLDNGWIKESVTKDHPTIAVNLFSDEREISDTEGNTIGAIYNRSGKAVETLVSNEKPADILEKALIEQLEKAGFIVIRTSGWNLNADTIPTYLHTDLILGGRIKVFWVESRAGLLTSTINSKVVYDLILADLHNKKMIWTGQLTGNDTKKSLAHTSDYFWMDLQTCISNSLTEAINNFFQNEQAQKAIISLIRLKF